MDDTLRDLRNRGSPKKMTPITIRLSQELEAEIKAVCDSHKIHFSVIIREAVERGWEAIKEDSESIRKLVNSLP